ncbi:hypothetical protein D9M72_553630 [compost metagenome]
MVPLSINFLTVTRAHSGNVISTPPIFCVTMGPNSGSVWPAKLPVRAAWVRYRPTPGITTSRICLALPSHIGTMCTGFCMGSRPAALQ